VRTAIHTLPTEIAAAKDNGLDFEDFFENGGIALHLIGADGTILHANSAELELLGITAEEYVGRQIADFHADRHVIEDILARLRRGKGCKNIPPGYAPVMVPSST
jgi:PAS domain S-box-containing protein